MIICRSTAGFTTTIQTMSNKTLDINFIRSCFPAFEQPLPQKTAFFENAGGSYVAAPVIERSMPRTFTEVSFSPMNIALPIAMAAGQVATIRAA